MKKSAFFAFAIILFLINFASADDILVPATYTTIQEAVNAATAGDTVIVSDGTYSGTGNTNIDFYGKDITVKSENGASACQIICANSTNGFYLHYGETSAAVIDGFTLTNCNSSGYRAVRCVGSSPTIRNCAINNCASAIYSYNASP